MDLTDSQWLLLQPLLPRPAQDPRGRPPLDERLILNAILWKLRSAAPWYDLPARFPSHQTCYRRYRQWRRLGVMDQIYRTLYQDLQERGDFDLGNALRERAIVVVRKGLRWVIFVRPDLQDTWQAATALVILRQLLPRLNRPGQKEVRPLSF